MEGSPSEKLPTGHPDEPGGLLIGAIPPLAIMPGAALGDYSWTT